MCYCSLQRLSMCNVVNIIVHVWKRNKNCCQVFKSRSEWVWKWKFNSNRITWTLDYNLHNPWLQSNYFWWNYTKKVSVSEGFLSSKNNFLVWISTVRCSFLKIIVIYMRATHSVYRFQQRQCAGETIQFYIFYGSKLLLPA